MSNISGLVRASSTVKVGATEQGPYLLVNSDGSINVNLENSGPTPTVNSINSFNEITNVPSGIETIVGTYTVTTSNCYLQYIEIFGTNKAQYMIYLNGIIINKLYSSFTSYGVSSTYKNEDALHPGLLFINGDILTITTIHSRPDLGDFNVRVQAIELS